MDELTANILSVPGACLYYERRGTGPVVLLIPGGNGDAGPYERVANALADQYTVVSYDRRGFSRSPLDGPVVDHLRLAADTDDAHHLLEHLTDEPAYIFGSSSGAIVALELMTKHSGQVRTLVAHEPPMIELLPDATPHLAFMDKVYDTYRLSGVDSAMEQFNAGIGLSNLPQPPDGIQLPPELTAMISRIHGNLTFWLEHELRQYIRIVPDIDTLKTLSARLVLAGGRDSRDHLPYRPNTVLAERIVAEIVDFPGGHIGYVTHPAEFASRLADVM